MLQVIAIFVVITFVNAQLRPIISTRDRDAVILKQIYEPNPDGSYIYRWVNFGKSCRNASRIILIEKLIFVSTKRMLNVATKHQMESQQISKASSKTEAHNWKLRYDYGCNKCFHKYLNEFHF